MMPCHCDIAGLGKLCPRCVMVAVQILIYHMQWTVGLVTQCHNEIRNTLGDLAALAYRDQTCEPIVQEGGDTVPALVADLGIRSVWLPHIEALFDI